MLRRILFLLLGLLGTVDGATAAKSDRVDNLPMYGQPQLARPPAMKKADAAFVKKVIKDFGPDLRAASNAWCEVGADFLQKGNLDFALRRFNQAWLLDPKNYEPFWGFGRAMLELDRFDEAVTHFETALSLCDDERQRVALLSDAATAFSYQAKLSASLTQEQRDAAFAKADRYYEECTRRDPSYANGWLRWAMALEREGKFEHAWVKVRRAQAAGASVPPPFLELLRKHVPEPAAAP